MPAVGDVIRGKYRIERVIGDGGMGTVYEARHQLLGTRVALKFLHPDFNKHPGLAARFQREARVSATIKSPHVVQVSDVDTTDDGAPFLVIELLEGESLQDLLNREHKLPPAQALEFAIQILSGLEAAHALDIVHRDLKPDNVFITQSPNGPLLKIIDFGIAKLRQTSEFKDVVTQAGTMMGTPEYMPPEQLYAAEQVDQRADLYSLGVLLYEMLSGQFPAQGEGAVQIVSHVQIGNVTALSDREPQLSPELAQAVHRAMAPDREQRYQTATELKQVLLELQKELGAAQARRARASFGESQHATPLGPMGSLAAPAPQARSAAERAGTGTVAPSGYDPLTTSGSADYLAKGDTEPGPTEPQLREPSAAQAPRLDLPSIPHPAPRRRRTSVLIFVLFGLALLLCASIVVIFVAQLPRSDTDPIGASAQPTPSAVLTPDRGQVQLEPDIQPNAAGSGVSAAEEPGPIPPRKRPAKTPPSQSEPSRKDRSSGNTGAKTPTFPFPLPSTLPLPSALPSTLPGLPPDFPKSLPSSLPPLPSTLPSTLPNIPGLFPPPAPSTAPSSPNERGSSNKPGSLNRPDKRSAD